MTEDIFKPEIGLRLAVGLDANDRGHPSFKSFEYGSIDFWAEMRDEQAYRKTDIYRKRREYSKALALWNQTSNSHMPLRSYVDWAREKGIAVIAIGNARASEPRAETAAQQQDRLLLQVLTTLGHDTKQRPPASNGNPGLKSKAKKLLNEQHPNVFLPNSSSKVFDHAWDRYLKRLRGRYPTQNMGCGLG